MKIKKIASVLTLSAGLIASTGLFAFEDGVVGATSEGEFDIRLLIDQEVRIWGFEDLVLTDSTAATEEQQDVCVASNSERYSLELSSANNLQLDSGSGTIDYKITVEADSVISGGTGVQNYTWEGSNPADPNIDFVTANSTTDDNAICGDGNNPRNLNIKAIIVNTGGVTDPGTYTDTVTLTVAAR